jgi:hypothetical protein
MTITAKVTITSIMINFARSTSLCIATFYGERSGFVAGVETLAGLCLANDRLKPRLHESPRFLAILHQFIIVVRWQGSRYNRLLFAKEAQFYDR